jgi:hypothetical protein
MNHDLLMVEHEKVTREEMVRLLNEDLAREYQARCGRNWSCASPRLPFNGEQ